MLLSLLNKLYAILNSSDISIYMLIAFIIFAIIFTVLIFPFKTLIHELGHALATLLVYYCCKFKKDDRLNFKLSIKIHWKYKIPNVFNIHLQEQGGTSSNFRYYVIDKPEYVKLYLFIVLSGLLLGNLLYIALFTLTLICIPNNNYFISIKIILLLDELLFLIINTIDFFRTKHVQGSDYNTYISFK